MATTCGVGSQLSFICGDLSLIGVFPIAVLLYLFLVHYLKKFFFFFFDEPSAFKLLRISYKYPELDFFRKSLGPPGTLFLAARAKAVFYFHQRPLPPALRRDLH